MIIPKSSLPGFLWPAVPSSTGMLLMALQFQIERSQWLAPDELLNLQFQQLVPLLHHARTTVPLYAERLQAKTFQSLSTNSKAEYIRDIWSEIPLLSRTDLTGNTTDLQSRDIPKHHGKITKRETSGSGGTSLKITDTAANGLFWQAITLREHLWQQRKFPETFVGIRSGRYAKNPDEVKEFPIWGPSTGNIFETGPSASMYNTMSIENQAAQLQRLNPGYILGYASNLQILGKYFKKKGLKLPALHQIQTYGEMLLPETRESCMDFFGVSLTDLYSCEEVGYIALQCPEHEHYHVQSEAILVEVIDDQNNSCKPGEIGRVIVTSLHNFAMPIIRYDIGDYVEVGSPCDCGRGLPVIKRILGRQQNRVRGLDGVRYWPELLPEIWQSFDEIDELRLIQDRIDHIEINVLSKGSLGDEGEAELGRRVMQALDQDFKFTIAYDRERQRPPSGKYQRFVCLV